MASVLTAVMCAAASCSAALAQFVGGVNVDFNTTTGAGAGQPTIVFAGAAGQGGYWNPVNPAYTVGSTRTLRNLANSADAVTLTFVSGATGTFTSNNASTTGDTELLMDDVLDVGGAGSTQEMTVGPFAPGVYRVVVYAWDPSSAANITGVSVSGSSGVAGAAVNVGGAMTGPNTLTAGVTHADIAVALPVADTIRIRCATVAGFGNINGFQIVRLNPARLYVNKNRAGTDTGDGLSWGTALREVQAALGAAATTPSVTEVWATAAATYRADTVLYSAGDPAATFNLRSNLSIFGYFNGTEGSLAERPVFGPAATRLSGNFTSRHVLTANGVTGVTIDSCNIYAVNDTSGGSLDGAGIRATNSSVTLKTIRFEQLRTLGFGGGIAALGTSNVTVDYADTVGLRAAGASFIYVDVPATATLRRVTMSTNTGTSYTGGLIDSRGTLTLENCLLANNTNPSWVIDASAGTAFTMVNCTVANNLSTVSSNVGLTLPGNAVVRNSIVWGNVGAGTPAFGGVIRLAGTTVSTSVTDSTFQAWDGSLNSPAYANNASDPRFTAPVVAGAPATPTNPVFYLSYALASRSPARDSGWNTPALSIGNDIALHPRIYDDPYFVNTGFAGGTVDRGCVEMQSPSDPCPGDVGSTGGVPGGDGARDNNDFIVFIDYFFTANPLADVGRTGGVPGSDGVFDNNDFVVFIDQFFAPCP